jgi:hypothetical protein
MRLPYATQAGDGGAHYVAGFLTGKGNRFAIEMSAPLKSKPNGVQMRPRGQITVAWQQAC